MANPGAQFTETVPENYDRYMAPMLFEPYADDIASRVEVREGLRVLEVACGTGVVTRYLRERLPANARLVASDFSEAMLSFAQRKLSALAGIEWMQADAAALPFPDGSFDAVVCQFGLMFVPDQAAAVHEAYRVLSPGGQFLFNTWDDIAENDFCSVTQTTIRSFFEQEPPTFYEIPFSLHDAAFLHRVMDEAGFQNITVRTLNLPSVSPCAADAAIGLVQGTPLALAIKERAADAEAITVAVEEALRIEFRDDPLRGRMCALVGEGIR